MQQINQKQHRQSIINHNCDKVVHRRDQRAGRNRRVYVDLLKNIGISVPTILEITIAVTSAIPTQPETSSA